MAELGRRVHLSQPGVTERVRKLEAAGESITGYTRHGGPRQARLWHPRDGARGLRRRPSRGSSKVVQQTPEVVNAYNVAGQDNWLLEIAVMDVAHLDAVISKFGQLTEVSTAIILHPVREHRLTARAVPRDDPRRSSGKSPSHDHDFATCDFCDTHKGGTDDTFRVLPPVFHDYGQRRKFHGQVVTVKCFEDNTHVKALVESPGDGRVLVVDGGGSLRRALVGGNIGAAAAKNGWAGVVVDGCVRDAAELAACDVGIRALALIPLPTERRNEGQRDVAVKVQGVWVRPSDWLYADEDGIVVSARALTLTPGAGSPGDWRTPGDLGMNDHVQPGFLVLHGNRAELLGDALFEWIGRHPLQPLEEEIFLGAEQRRGRVAEDDAGGRRSGVCAATRVELPARFLWRSYRPGCSATRCRPAPRSTGRRSPGG